MTDQRQPGFLGRHTAAVVHHADEPPPARLDLDIDAVGAGVDGILGELLDHRGRPLDHLTSRDLVREGLRQHVDAWRRSGQFGYHGRQGYAKSARRRSPSFAGGASARNREVVER